MCRRSCKEKRYTQALQLSGKQYIRKKLSMDTLHIRVLLSHPYCMNQVLVLGKRWFLGPALLQRLLHPRVRLPPIGKCQQQFPTVRTQGTRVIRTSAMWTRNLSHFLSKIQCSPQNARERGVQLQCSLKQLEGRFVLFLQAEEVSQDTPGLQ